MPARHSLKKSLRRWGLGLLIAGAAASVAGDAVLGLIGNSEQRSVLLSVAMILRSVVASVGIPLGAGLFSVSFLASDRSVSTSVLLRAGKQEHEPR